MIIQNRTISVALKYPQGQTSKKAHKILISQTIMDVARGGGPSPPPNRNVTNDKNVTKKVLLLHFQFLLASLQQ